MKTETWKKILTGCGIASVIGTAAGIGSAIIGMRHPETQNLPAQHVEDIKKIVADTLKERETKG